MPRYQVTNEFIDRVSGRRRYPGELIELNNERAERWQKAKVIGAELVEPESKVEEPVKAEEHSSYFQDDASRSYPVNQRRKAKV
jgi:hypothetical protein